MITARFNRVRFVSAILMALTFTLCLSYFSLAEEKPAKKETKAAATVKKGPKMEHEGTLPGELCVTCHMESEAQDPKSITPKINNKHDVCNRCHKEDGTVTSGHCGCEDASDPMDCEQCHTTPAMGDNPSADDMNDLCLKCH